MSIRYVIHTNNSQTVDRVFNTQLNTKDCNCARDSRTISTHIRHIAMYIANMYPFSTCCNCEKEKSAASSELPRRLRSAR